MATELKGVPIGSLPEASNLNTTDQLIAYRGGQAYRSNVGALGEAANDNISDAFDSGKSYVAGDYAIYNDTLFKFTADHSGSWNSADVEQVTVGTELSELNTNKANIIPSGSFNERIWTAGVLTTSRAAAYFSIPIPKALGTVKSVVINQLSIRQNGSYLAENATSGWDSVTATQYTSLVTILISKSSGWGGTNNDAIAVWADYTVTIE